MKIRIITVLIISAIFIGCEDEIFPEMPEAEPVTVIDAWISNKPETQVIRISRTIPYLQNEELPGVRGATVVVSDNEGKEYLFNESEVAGEYVWEPSAEEASFGQVGDDYTITVSVNETVFHSFGSMNRVPDIDSISFRFEEGNSFFPDSYFASFYASDLEGRGDTYWIKAWKNGDYLNKPGEINIAFDAGFTAGSVVDGIPFIQPVREGINPFEQNEDDKFLSPYLPGDSVYVEIHSISTGAFIFLNEVVIQTDRPGGFAELFAQPLSNVPTNIENVSNDEPVIGFFNVAAVSSLGKKLDPGELPE